MAWIMDTYAMHQGHTSRGGDRQAGLRRRLARAGSTPPGAGCRLHPLSGRAPGLPRRGTVVIQGFGNVGGVPPAAERDGAGSWPSATSTGGIYNPAGLDVRARASTPGARRAVAGFPGAQAVTNAELLELPCDVLVPAAIEGQITAENAGRLRCKLIAEAANGPTTPDADRILDQRGDHGRPDILCNAGGVIVSYFEWVQDYRALLGRGRGQRPPAPDHGPRLRRPFTP